MLLAQDVVGSLAFFALAEGTQGQLALLTPLGGVPSAQVVLGLQPLTGKG